MPLVLEEAKLKAADYAVDYELYSEVLDIKHLVLLDVGDVLQFSKEIAKAMVSNQSLKQITLTDCNHNLNQHYDQSMKLKDKIMKSRIRGIKNFDLKMSGFFSDGVTNLIIEW
jgi:Ran GTPase-activating protein (RanGAP) involved in mRNA processing and transport